MRDENNGGCGVSVLLWWRGTLNEHPPQPLSRESAYRGQQCSQRKTRRRGIRSTGVRCPRRLMVEFRGKINNNATTPTRGVRAPSTETARAIVIVATPRYDSRPTETNWRLRSVRYFVHILSVFIHHPWKWPCGVSNLPHLDIYYLVNNFVEDQNFSYKIRFSAKFIKNYFDVIFNPSHMNKQTDKIHKGGVLCPT